MKMIVIVNEWTFECNGPKGKAVNPELKKDDIIEVTDDFAMKLAKRGVAKVYRGKEPATPFPPPHSNVTTHNTAAVQDVLKEIAKNKGGADAPQNDGANAGAGKGANNPGKS